MTSESHQTLKAKEIITCYGHENVRAEHRSTFEITKEENLTKAGTCIIGINADKGAADLEENFKKILSDDRSILNTTLIIENINFSILSCGSSKMAFTHSTDLVWRRSNFVCSRTIGIYSDFSAVSIPRNIIDLLKTGAKMTVVMEATLNPKAQSPSSPHLQEFFDNFEELLCPAHKEKDFHQDRRHHSQF